MFVNAELISERALWLVQNTIHWSRPTLCHGLAGGIHALIDGYQTLGRRAMYESCT